MNELKLLAYQRAWVADRSAVKVYEKSRQIGITWTEAYDAAMDAASHGGTDWWYIGYNKEMALEFIEAAAEWARLINSMRNPAIEQVILEDEDKDILAYRIRFASSHKIVALSSRPSNLRGKQGVAIIDEAAFHDNLAGLLKAALALTMWGGRVHIISTHNGADSPFAQLVNDIRAGRKPYSLHRTNLDDALAQGLYRAICRTNGALWSATGEEVWRRDLVAQYGDAADEELFCIPSLSGGVFLPTALIESVMRDGIPVLRWNCRDGKATAADAQDWIRANLDQVLRERIQPYLLSCFGEDFGRSGDITVIWPLQIAENLKRLTPLVCEMRNVPYEQQRQVLFAIADKLPRFFSGALDSSGNGDWLAEAACLKYGGSKDADPPGRIKPVVLNVEWYRENMPKYKAAFEDKRIELPMHADILADHQLLRMERGIARVPETRTRGSDAGQRHGDSAIAGALAWFASGSDRHEYSYETPHKQIRGPYAQEDNQGWDRGIGRGHSFGKGTF